LTRSFSFVIFVLAHDFGTLTISVLSRANVANEVDMLPDYIINEIKKREREKDCSDEWFIECPIPEPKTGNNNTPSIPDSASQERGVAIIDFTI
jgi:hypothetical protein